MGMLFSRIKSAPAEGLLLFCALVTSVYSLNFMFASACYVTGGEGCFSLLNNGTTLADDAWGNGAPEFAFNGILMFGILMSNLLILNEGARGKWTIMIPVLIGFVVGTVVLWTMWVENGSSEAPKFVLPIVTLAYAAAYYLLMGEDEVNEGMSDFKIGLGVKDPVTIVALLFVIATGAFYVVRQLVNPESVIEAINGVTGADGLGAPAKVTVAFTGALLLPYVLWATLILTQGAEGMWPVAHPPLFAFMAVAVANYFGFVFGPVREFTEQNQMDAMAGPMTLLIFLVVYLRLREEGIEEGMTFSGEPSDSRGFDFMFTCVVVMVSFGYFLVNMLS